MIVQTKLVGERHFMFVMVYRFAHAGICKAVTLRPVGLKSYVLKQNPCLFVQSIDHQILTFKLSLKISETICLKSKKVPRSSILLGDFNVDYQLRSTAKSRLQTLARAFSLEQLITSATRITQSSKSTINLIFANNIHRVVASGVYSLGISDHSLIFCVIEAGVAKSGGNYRDINYRCYKNYNQHNFKYDLENVDWSFMDSVSDINNTVNNWCNKFSEIADKHAPIKTRRAKCTNRSPWITPELTDLMHERDYHQKQAHKTNLEYHWQQFRELRNLVNNQIKLAKSKYYQDSVNANKNNPSNLWKTLNELTFRNKSETNPSCIISEEKPVTDQKSIATILQPCQQKRSQKC